MILSVSRRTDIPNYYADWFYNRVREGFVCVRNPFNQRQISKILISPETVDCIVFWTKNPAPMLSRLGELADYHYYFQFTLTGYGRDAVQNIQKTSGLYDPGSSILCGRIYEAAGDTVTERKVESLKEAQLSLF